MNDQTTNQKRWIILVITSLSTFMATLDGSIVNIALPIMANELHVAINAIQWVVTAYLLTISIMLLVWGKLSDLFGKKYIFASGFIIFSLGSALCSFSHSLTFIVIARVIQAIGASAMMSLSQAIVTGAFPQAERGRALGFVGTMVALGSLAGPSLGGILVGKFGWPSIFIINIPIGLIGFICTLIIIPELFEKDTVRGFDIKGTLLFAFSIMLLFLGLLFAQQGVMPVTYLIPTVLIAFLGLYLFIRVERKAASPLLNVSLLKIPEFSFGLIAAYLSFIATNSVMLFMPFYLQDLRNFSPFQAGLIISAFPITMAVVAPISGMLSDRLSYRPLTIIGMSVATIALLLFSTLNASTGIVEIILLMVLLGGGASIFQSPNNSSIMGSVPRAQLGIAGGMSALFRNLGMVSGTTISVFIFSFVANININNLTGNFSTYAFMQGLSVIFIFCSICTCASALISVKRSLQTNKQGKPESRPE